MGSIDFEQIVEIAKLVVDNLDIFFSCLMGLLFFYAIFLVKDIAYRFFIFFVCIFLNIVNFALVIYLQYNFLMIVMLNIFLMCLGTILLLYSRNSNNPLNYIIDNMSSIYLLRSIATFLLTFLCVNYIFLTIDKQHVLKTEKANLIVTRKVFVENNGNIDTRGDIFNLKKNKSDILYSRKIKIFEDNNVWKRYSIIIMIYNIFIITMYFLTGDSSKGGKDFYER